MKDWIIDVIEQFGYLGVFLLITLENLFPPIPSEVILTFGGFMTTQTSLTVVGVITVSTLGSVFGAAILYGVGRIFDITKLEKVVEKWGHILRLTKDDIQKANTWFLKYGVWTVFFCRFIPLIRSLISIPAGMSHMNFALFLVLTTIGTIIWNTVLVLIGTVVGESWETIVGFMDVYSNVTYVVLTVLFVLFVLLIFKKKRSAKI